mgnify:CR=1 FL=1
MALRPVKFLLDVHHIGRQQTGNETWARNVARELSAPDISKDELAFAATAHGAAAVAAIVGRRPWVVSESSGRRLLVDLPRIIRREHPDAILVHYTLPLSRCAAAVMVHDVAFLLPESRHWVSSRMRARLRVALTLAVRGRCVLLTPSDFSRTEILSRTNADPDRVFVAPNAVDPELLNLFAARTRSRADDPIRVLTVGNVLPRKNLGVVATAVSQLRREGMNIQLRVVGSVPRAGQPMAAEIRRLLVDHVEFSGYVDTAQLAQEYLDADLLAFPSLYEGFGIPAIEAMAAGLPVIVSESTGQASVARGYARAVDSRDPLQWSRAIADVIRGDRPPAADLTAAALQFSWRSTAESTLHALELAAS